MKLSLERLVARDTDWTYRLATLDALAERRLSRWRPGRLRSDQLDDWLAFATSNRVAPMVAHALLLQDAGSSTQRARWTRIHDDTTARTQRLLDELDGLAEQLGREEIRVVALKNAGIARGLYACAGCCPMGDIDVLVPRERFLEAHELTLEAGFSRASRSVVEPADLVDAQRRGGAEYIKTNGSQPIWLELNWRPVGGRWIRPDQEPDGAELLSRSLPIEGTEARLLAPVDNLLQVALHTAKHSYLRPPGLRLHTDVDRLVAAAPPDWEAVTLLAKRLEVRTAVYFSLAMAEALLETPIPEPVLEALAPPRWKREVMTSWIRARDVFYPDDPKFGRLGMMLFHALLYDDLAGLASSALDTRRSELRASRLPGLLRRGAARVADIALRYDQ